MTKQPRRREFPSGSKIIDEAVATWQRMIVAADTEEIIDILTSLIEAAEERGRRLGLKQAVEACGAVEEELHGNSNTQAENGAALCGARIGALAREGQQ